MVLVKMQMVTDVLLAMRIDMHSSSTELFEELLQLIEGKNKNVNTVSVFVC